MHTTYTREQQEAAIKSTCDSLTAKWRLWAWKGIAPSWQFDSAFV